MKTLDKIYLNRIHPDPYWFKDKQVDSDIEYIRKDALMEWIERELERLYELLPDADNENLTQMELRYLGQYMQMEVLENKLNSM